MKKLILSAALIAGVSFFTACNNDDDGGGNNNGPAACMTCTFNFNGQTEEADICREDYETDEEYNEAIETAEMVGDCVASS